MQLVFNPILGRWSDRVGRRRVLLISMAGSVGSHILLGVADISVSLPLLFAARMLDGITGANVATAQAYIADVTTAENRARGMGLFGAAFGLGFVVGPALGAGLAFLGRHISGETYGTAWPAFGAAVISLVAWLLVWLYLRPSLARHGHAMGTSRKSLNVTVLRGALSQPRLRELLTIMFGAVFAFVLLETTFVYVCTSTFGVTETGTGLIFAYIGALMVIMPRRAGWSARPPIWRGDFDGHGAVYHRDRVSADFRSPAVSTTDTGVGAVDRGVLTDCRGTGYHDTPASIR